jgi:hypothetical protein
MQFEDLDDIPGTPVWSSEGRSYGRVTAVHVPGGSRQPLLIQVTADGRRQYVVPLIGASLAGNGLILGYDAAAIESAPMVDSVIALSAGEAAYVLERFGVKLAGSDQLVITRRSARTGDVGSVHPRVRELPPMRTDPELPPIVVIKPGIQDERS